MLSNLKLKPIMSANQLIWSYFKQKALRWTLFLDKIVKRKNTVLCTDVSAIATEAVHSW